METLCGGVLFRFKLSRLNKGQNKEQNVAKLNYV